MCGFVVYFHNFKIALRFFILWLAVFKTNLNYTLQILSSKASQVGAAHGSQRKA